MRIPATILRLMLAATATIAAAGCSGAIFDYEGNCAPEYRVRFTYDRNMKFADAFANEVGSVTLYLIGQDGRIAWQHSDSGAALASGDWYMPVDVAPGTYSLLAWCGEGIGSSYDIPAVNAGDPKDALSCSLVRKTGEDGTQYIDNYLHGLYHGYLGEQVFPDSEGVHEYTVSLTKNTNTLTVVLQHLSGEDVDADRFEFTVTDDNGLLAWDNSPIEDGTVEYRAWYTGSGTAEVETASAASTKAVTSVSVAVAELSLSRLVRSHRPVLTVTEKESGEVVLAVPVIDYALLVKGHYGREMDDQEYLDRQDEYSMTFFLDENERWVSSRILINSWVVVLSDIEI